MALQSRVLWKHNSTCCACKKKRSTCQIVPSLECPSATSLRSRWRICAADLDSQLSRLVQALLAYYTLPRAALHGHAQPKHLQLSMLACRCRHGKVVCTGAMALHAATVNLLLRRLVVTAEQEMSVLGRQRCISSDTESSCRSLWSR